MPVKITVYARRELLGPRAFAHGPAVLLEGSWPPAAPGCLHWSLDEAIDGRFEWIDALAADLAEEISQTGSVDDGLSSAGLSSTGLLSGPGLYSSADLNALALRYYLVKLVRIVAFFTEIRPLQAGDELEIALSPGSDEDLADLFQELAAASGAKCEVKWNARNHSSGGFPKNGRPRRLIGRLARLVEPGKDIASHRRRRVVLCGNPRILDPIAEELLHNGCQIWWLYDRFAFHSWLRWRLRGVGQLLCNSSLGRKNRLTAHLPERLPCLGVNLTPAVGRWMAGRLQEHGRRQTRAVREINAHFRRVRPHRIVLSEDATPFARAAVSVARRHGTTSFVVQHGVPCCRFGFTPIAADHLLAWGRSSKDQLLDWGALPQQVHVTGSPQHDRIIKQFQHSNGGQTTRVLWGKASRATGLLRSLASAEPSGTRTVEAARRLIASSFSGRPILSPNILLLATTPPREGRPDSIAIHLTQATHAQMLRIAMAAVAKIEGATLDIKLHPRAPSDPIMKSVLAEFKSLPVKLVRKGSLQASVAHADCILSCMSTAGVEATLSGVPVVQLLPQGSADIMPHRRWGLIGSARTQAELDRLLSKILLQGWKSPGTVDEDVFANSAVGNSAIGATAAAVRAILEKTPLQRIEHRGQRTERRGQVEIR